MSGFITYPKLVPLREEDGKQLRSRSGRRLFYVEARFLYLSNILGLIAVPAHFVTDLASVPRLPLLYLFFGDHFPEAAVVHDFLYSAKSGQGVSREQADAVLKEACLSLGEPRWRAWGAWAGVRLGGWAAYEAR